ncbi:MAG: Cytochrome c551 peroxidase [Luteibacter sp.]|uniref:cytochrome-c peroxidase n=1 Tax=Luteibacter sp. TaxID=1886636 RepID=UPI0013821861|nr:MAG: Cytochrome c551 peroxidase [Luteibacter sp.]
MKWQGKPLWGNIAAIVTCCFFVMLFTQRDLARAATPTITPAELGHKLFFDTALGADGKTSCASCHQPEHAYAQHSRVATGVFGRQGTRNAPSLLAPPEQTHFFWDGRRATLEEAVLDPVFHTRELGLDASTDIATRLDPVTYYPLFRQAFGLPEGVRASHAQLRQALAAYIRSIPRPKAPFDRYRDDHDEEAIGREAREGYRLFTGKAGCAQCHTVAGTPARFSDDAFHPTGTGLERLVDGMPRLTGELAAKPTDPASVGELIASRADIAATGRFAVTHRPSDVGLFRTPSLRYVAQTAPYMHDGSIPTLEDAVDQEVYWRSLAAGKALSLTVSERAALIAFLRALSIDDHEMVSVER